jgi:phage baseplate assembly protein W
MTIQTVRSTPRYKDFYGNFDAHPVRKDLYVLTDVDAVKRSIKNLVFTSPGERFFQPYLGGGIDELLFENIDNHTSNMLKVYVESTITNYEPRALVSEVVITPQANENGYHVKIVFSTINNPTPITYDFLLTRVR